MSATDSFSFYIQLLHKAITEDIDKSLRNEGFEIGYAQWSLLKELWIKDGKTQQQLADALNRNKAGITRILDNLERKKLVKRKLDNSNRRIKRVVLTSAGRELQESLSQFALAHQNKIEQNLSSPEINVSIHTMKKVLKNLI